MTLPVLGSRIILMKKCVVHNLSDLMKTNSEVRWI